ncbi:conjugative transfer pilus assembly protein TraH [Sphingobium sp. B2D3A]|uniref:conjugal transfer protein TraH n=1 Tax=unclassified Sphingobium TaxID=2611147 RepID=UPI0022245411|nr:MULTISPECIES: conjugal transfer protein TraH [unclassified Sphingobium]MCW2339168.1 conjugative transfer pilus assembly protein TraH [Sphingobium sp. B2D3A]MCW2386888.1 conjugative transfer pilus assembly protein TraH [Sphingobium sp. B2D3D]
MRKSTIARFARSTCAIAVSAAMALAPARAGVGSDMTGFFQEMGGSANVTGPTAFQGQSAGYYSLGSVWTRFPQKTVYPANLQLPQVRAGCGGIDMFTGSFSFVNASELVAMMKAVANNALGFAFKLAIDAISPQIGGVMDKMQQIAQQANDMNLSSCEAGAALVGSMLPRDQLVTDRVCQTIGTSKGIFSDWARSRQGCGNGGQQTSTLNANTDPALAAQMAGPKNYAWDLIKASPLGAQSQEMRELVMTMVGTIIVPKRANDTDQPNIQFIGGQVGPVLDALLDGDKPVAMLGCVDTTACLSTSSRTLLPLGDSALVPHVRKLILSMSDKAIADQALTTEERQLLSIASVPIYKIIAVQAASGFRLSSSEMDSLSEIVALDMLNAIVGQMLEQVSSARGGLVNAGDAEKTNQFLAQLQDVRQRVASRDAKMEARVSRTMAIIERTMAIETTLQHRMAPSMAASLSFSRALSAQGLR